MTLLLPTEDRQAVLMPLSKDEEVEAKRGEVVIQVTHMRLHRDRR